MAAKAISAKEIEEKALNKRAVWFVFNETKQEVPGFPSDNSNDRITPVFLEKEDAETFKFIVSKLPYYQDCTLSLQSEIFQKLFEEIVEDEQEFMLQMYGPDEAREWFEDFQDILRTRPVDNAPNL
jgi:adenine-specific DNA methylase